DGIRDFHVTGVQTCALPILVSAIENAIVATLAACHIEAYPKPDAPGVYVRKGQGEAKIASLGIRIRRGCSYHGLSLNVDMDLARSEERRVGKERGSEERSVR